jgi:predicted unusual protein kinase regulating ubiquinone biosynthesis (AarF/ABC1/UbiB family)
MVDSESKSGEKNSRLRRVRRYAQVGSSVGGVAMRAAGSRLFGFSPDKNKEAADLRAALGGLKGPIMKVAQMLATIPDLVPPEYADELRQLQSSAPAMGWPFVKRRMSAELGEHWQKRFAEFDHEAAAAASLGQVHKAKLPDGRVVACKLQYPDMASAVEADLKQLKLLLAVHKRMDTAIDTSQVAIEIGARLREELDYALEAKHTALYRLILAEEPGIRVPDIIAELSTKRLLTMSWLEGKPLLKFAHGKSQEVRNHIGDIMFRAWWHPFNRFGAIHGDPHLGNYSVYGEGLDSGINLLDYGCIRTFGPKFVGGVVDLYHSLQRNDIELSVHAYETWGFRGLKKEVIESLNIWAHFIYGPMLEDRVRSIADGVSPGEYGRREAFEVHRRLRLMGPVKPPREFVFMDRAAIGLGGVFLYLGAELNFHRLFNAAIENFSLERIAETQRKAFGAAGVPLPNPEGDA